MLSFNPIKLKTVHKVNLIEFLIDVEKLAKTFSRTFFKGKNIQT